MLQDLKQYTTVLLDSTLSPEKMTGNATTDAAVVNVALMSHILANTSAFYEFAVRHCSACMLPWSRKG